MRRTTVQSHLWQVVYFTCYINRDYPQSKRAGYEISVHPEDVNKLQVGGTVRYWWRSVVTDELRVSYWYIRAANLL